MIQPQGCLNIKMSFCHHGDSHYEDKTMVSNTVHLLSAENIAYVA